MERSSNDLPTSFPATEETAGTDSGEDLKGQSNVEVSDDNLLFALERPFSEACSLLERESTSEQPGLLNSNSHVSDYDSSPVLEQEPAIRKLEQQERREREATEIRQGNESGEGTPAGSKEEGPSQHGCLKGGRKDQSIANCSSSDTLKIDSSPEWSCNGAIPKKNVQRVSVVPLSTKRVDKDILLKRVEEADYIGIDPGFLARHTVDNSISMTNDMWNVENTEGKPLDILSSYERFGCYPDRSFHSQSPCPPSLLLSEGPDCSAKSQGPSPIQGTTLVLPGSLTYLSSNEQLSQIHNLCNLPPPPTLPSFPYNGCEYYHQLLNDDLTNGAVQSRSLHIVSTADDILFAQGPSSASQGEATTSFVNTGLGLPHNVINQTGIGHCAFSVCPTLIMQSVITSQTETSLTSERSTRKHQESERIDREPSTAIMLTNGESTSMKPGLLNSNSHVSDDNSLAALEQRVAEACSLVERVLKEREEKEKVRKERERRQREERARRELQEWDRREREAREMRQGSEEEARPHQHAALSENPRWLCEHFQRLCRVKFPCCRRFYPCHHCHNNSGECGNNTCKAKEALCIECSVCRHQQLINRDAHTCARCKTKMSAYFCSICKHFTNEDKHPYHCKKCRICRIHQNRSFHCDVCNVCLDKRLQGKHKCRPNSRHDERCIRLEERPSWLSTEDNLLPLQSSHEEGLTTPQRESTKETRQTNPLEDRFALRGLDDRESNNPEGRDTCTEPDKEFMVPIADNTKCRVTSIIRVTQHGRQEELNELEEQVRGKIAINDNLHEEKQKRRELAADGASPAHENVHGRLDPLQGPRSRPPTGQRMLGRITESPVIPSRDHNLDVMPVRPRDRSPLQNAPLEPSLVDILPQEVPELTTHGSAGVEPLIDGINDEFLARHSEDRGLLESLEMQGANRRRQVISPRFGMPLALDGIIESLDSIQNSARRRGVNRARALGRSIEAARASREEVHRRWCTCVLLSGEFWSEDPICTRCFRHQYLGPSSCPRPAEQSCVCLETNGGQTCRVYGTITPERCRPDSGHDECCICLEDASSGCQILPCSHKVHPDCLITNILNGEFYCPRCGCPFFRRG